MYSNPYPEHTWWVLEETLLYLRLLSRTQPGFYKEPFYIPKFFFSRTHSFIHPFHAFHQDPCYIPFYVEPIHWVLLRTFLYSKSLIWNPLRGFYRDPFRIPRLFSRTHSVVSTMDLFIIHRFSLEPTQRGSTENLFRFQGFYPETTQEVLLRTFHIP